MNERRELIDLIKTHPEICDALIELIHMIKDEPQKADKEERKNDG